MKRIATICLPAALALALVSCQEKTPNRDYIPILKQRVYLVQQAVKNRDASALDSLLTDDLKGEGRNADSLVRFVAGPDGQFRFDRFANCEIYYNDDKARADCEVVDSAGNQNGRITLTLTRKGDRWLLKRFDAATAVEADSAK